MHRHAFLMLTITFSSLTLWAYAHSDEVIVNGQQTTSQQLAAGCPDSLPVDSYLRCLEREWLGGRRISLIRNQANQHPQLAATGCGQYIDETAFWDCFKTEILGRRASLIDEPSVESEGTDSAI